MVSIFRNDEDSDTDDVQRASISIHDIEQFPILALELEQRHILEGMETKLESTKQWRSLHNKHLHSEGERWKVPIKHTSCQNVLKRSLPSTSNLNVSNANTKSNLTTLSEARKVANEVSTLTLELKGKSTNKCKLQDINNHLSTSYDSYSCVHPRKDVKSSVLDDSEGTVFNNKYRLIEQGKYERHLENIIQELSTVTL